MYPDSPQEVPQLFRAIQKGIPSSSPPPHQRHVVDVVAMIAIGEDPAVVVAEGGVRVERAGDGAAAVDLRLHVQFTRHAAVVGNRVHRVVVHCLTVTVFRTRTTNVHIATTLLDARVRHARLVGNSVLPDVSESRQRRTALAPIAPRIAVNQHLSRRLGNGPDGGIHEAKPIADDGHCRQRPARVAVRRNVLVLYGRRVISSNQVATTHHRHDNGAHISYHTGRPFASIATLCSGFSEG